MWNKTETVLPEYGDQVIGYSQEWEDEDNPEGTRLCWITDECQCVSTYWHEGNRGFYLTDHDSEFPSHWQPLPSKPE